jgi:hypothetical protein
MSRSDQNAWLHSGFAEFSKGSFEDGGSNLYVRADGIIETIHRTDVNNDGYVDIIFPNSHGYVERGPTWIYKVGDKEGQDWPRQELPSDSGWTSRIVDLDGDGYPDLIVANGENGVTSELTSYVYWGGKDGLTGERSEFTTAGAYDVAVMDVDGDGRLDLIFPSAWEDHHNAGKPRPLQVFLQRPGRQFEDATERIGISGIATVSVAAGDLNHNGHCDLVVANYRSGFEYEIESFIYWGRHEGFDAAEPLRLPTRAAQRVILADLDNDGFDEIVFGGGGEVRIFWNREGKFSPDDRTVLTADGFTSMFREGDLHVAAADVDRDGVVELLIATRNGVQIRSADSLEDVQLFLPLEYANWVCPADLTGDGWVDLIVSRYEDGISHESTSAVYWNGPDGFSPDRTTWLPTAGVVGATAGDLDGDGRMEVIFNNTMIGPSQNFADFPSYVYLGNADAEYSVDRRQEFPAGFGNAYALCDLDLDGYPDMAFVTAHGVRLFHGGPEGPRPDRYLDLPMPPLPVQSVHVADFNRDGYLDLVVTTKTYDDKPESIANSSRIFWNSAEGFSPDRWENLPTYSMGPSHLADINRDGYVDIIVADERGYLDIFLGGPDGFSPDRTWKVPLPGPKCAGITSADLTGNGYHDIVVGMMGHYIREPDTFCILYGGPEGYDPANIQHYQGSVSPHQIAVADVNNNGCLDLVVAVYSSTTTRELPMRIFWGDGNRIDLENPTILPAESSAGLRMIDLNRNGWLDMVVSCHRNNIGHQVDSLIYWNGPAGMSSECVTRLPAMGPHWTTRDNGNGLTRKPEESYISPPHSLDTHTPSRIHWEAEVPETTELKFQLRWAESEAGLNETDWRGPVGVDSYYVKSGDDVTDVPSSAAWLQYKADFGSRYNLSSPRLREVRIETR